MVKFFVTYLSTLLFLMLTVMQVQAKVYHWVDGNGINHFSDTSPSTEIQALEVENKNVILTTYKQSPSTHQSIEKNKAIPIKQTYDAKIVSPKEDMAIRSNNGTLVINVTIKPEKKSNQLLQLLLDGLVFGKSQTSTTIRALNVDRGTHQLQVQLLDSEGKVLTKTQIVTVHVQRAAIK